MPTARTDFFNQAIHKGASYPPSSAAGCDILTAQPGWRRVVAQAALWGLPTPAFSTALGFYDGYRTAKLPASLLQAQRDYFGCASLAAHRVVPAADPARAARIVSSWREWRPNMLIGTHSFPHPARVRQRQVCVAASRLVVTCACLHAAGRPGRQGHPRQARRPAYPLVELPR